MTSWFKLSVLAAVAAASMGANAADTGTINVTGRLISAGCAIDAASTAAPIELGTQLIGTDFDVAGKTSVPVDFNIHLTQCPTTQTGVTLTATGTPDVDNAKLLQVNGVTGLGVVLYNADNSQIDLNTASAVTQIDPVTNEATIPLKAAVMSTGALVGNGEFTAATNFTLTYN